MNDESARRYLPSLRSALLVMALPPAEQLRRSTPGCVACELLDDFEISCKDVLENLELPEQQSKPLYELLNIVGDMQNADLECFNSLVLTRPVWQRLREKAHEALIRFSWQDARVEPFTEVEPGVWLRRRNNS